MAKGCAGVAVFFCVCLMLFCGVGAFFVAKAKQQAEEAEAKMTPQEKADRDKQKSEQMAQLDMQVAAKRAVLAAMKAPDTAKVEIEKAGKFSDHGWGASGVVTAQNSFGVPLRQRFIVKFYRPDNATGASQFRLASLKIDNNETKDESVLRMLDSENSLTAH